MNRKAWMIPMTQEAPRLAQAETRCQPWRAPDANLTWGPVPAGIATLAWGYSPISLAEMDAVALLDRTDTKFVLTTEQLLHALAAIQKDYWMLSVDGQRLNHYRTLYFDTPDFALYNLHVNERAERYKVRSREYADSGLSFLEVKHKTRKDRTVKSRIRTEQPVIEMDAGAEDWLRSVYPYDGAQLQPKLWNTFTRITLVNKCQCERVTLDVDLTFYTQTRVATLDGLAIAEVKLDKQLQASPFLAQMRALRVQPRGISKYCLGVAMLYDTVKKNTLKPKMLWIEKQMQGAQK